MFTLFQNYWYICCCLEKYLQYKWTYYCCGNLSQWKGHLPYRIYSSAAPFMFTIHNIPIIADIFSGISQKKIKYCPLGNQVELLLFWNYTFKQRLYTFLMKKIHCFFWIDNNKLFHKLWFIEIDAVTLGVKIITSDITLKYFPNIWSNIKSKLMK
jgi:hypothetical protein